MGCALFVIPGSTVVQRCLSNEPCSLSSRDVFVLVDWSSIQRSLKFLTSCASVCALLRSKSVSHSNFTDINPEKLHWVRLHSSAFTVVSAGAAHKPTAVIVIYY